MMNRPIPLSDLNAEFLPLDGAPHSEEPLLREPIRRIYRVPSSIRTGSDEEYVPNLVSFGPYHFGKPHLRAYEAHKCRVFVHCLRRARKHLRDIEAEVWATLDGLMSCYDKLGQRWLDYPQDLVRVMVIDGCFLLELVRPVFAHPSDDPVYSLRIEGYNFIDILDDMMLLENQLPLPFLRLLHHHLMPTDWLMHVGWIFQSIYSDFNPTQFMALEVALHPLDYVASSMEIIRSKTELPLFISKGNWNSAIELSNAGVDFQVSNTNQIEFNNGILRLPLMVVNYRTKRKLLNAVAYEQLRGGDTMVTASVIFMANLMKTPEDVNVLCSAGIILNNLGNHQEVVDLYSDTSYRLMDFGRHHEAILCEIDEYCGTKWRRFRAHLKRTYFRSPWAMLSLVYAVIIFLFTVSQTFYTIAAYYSSTNDSRPK